MDKYRSPNLRRPYQSGAHISQRKYLFIAPSEPPKITQMLTNSEGKQVEKIVSYSLEITTACGAVVSPMNFSLVFSGYEAKQNPGRAIHKLGVLTKLVIRIQQGKD